MVKKEWGEFFKVALAVFFIGLGIVVIGESAGQPMRIVLGIAFISVGIGMLAK